MRFAEVRFAVGVLSGGVAGEVVPYPCRTGPRTATWCSVQVRQVRTPLRRPSDRRTHILRTRQVRIRQVRTLKVAPARFSPDRRDPVKFTLAKLSLIRFLDGRIHSGQIQFDPEVDRCRLAEAKPAD